SDPLHHEFAGELLTLPSRIAREHKEYLSLMIVLCEISTSRSQENVHDNPSLIIESPPVSPIPVEDSDSVQEEIDIFLVSGDLIPPGVENDDSEDEDNSTFLSKNESSILEPSSPRPPPEPPDVCLNFKPNTAMKNDEDFNQGEIVLSLNVEDVNSFTFVIWTFLPSFTYPEDLLLFFLSVVRILQKSKENGQKPDKHGHGNGRARKEPGESYQKYALTVNPTIYASLIEQFWQSATVKTVNNGEQQLSVTVDGQAIAITEASVRIHLQLAYTDGISSLPNTEIFEQLTLMGYVSNDDKLTFQNGKFSPQ
ncbi:hypothetical protein Tco_0912650, partial [Tanacetum coccineum]